MRGEGEEESVSRVREGEREADWHGAAHGT